MPKLTKDQQRSNQELRKIPLLGVGAFAVGILIIFEPFITASTYNTKTPALNLSSVHAWGLIVIGIGLILLYRFIKPNTNEIDTDTEASKVTHLNTKPEHTD